MRKSSISTLVILCLLVLFVGGSGFVVITGAQFYATMIKESELSLSKHSLLLYFNHRIKQHDGQGQINVLTQNRITALCLTQDGYVTLIYEVDGYLVEQSSESALINPLESQKILALSELKFTYERYALGIEYLDQKGERIQLKFTLIAGGSSS